MDKNFTISFIRLENLQPDDLQNIRAKLLETKYDEILGFGFTKVSGSSDYINATLVKRTPTYIPEFEIETLQFIQKEIFLFNEIDFEIDFKFSILEIFGSTKIASKVLSALVPIIDKRIRINPIQFTPVAVAQRVIESGLLKNVERLVINNFEHMDGVIGRYDMKINDASLGVKIIKEYNDEISKLVLNVSTPEVDHIRLGISRNGTLNIRCEESFLSETLLRMKNSLFLGKEI
jgi:hypothetical protein